MTILKSAVALTCVAAIAACSKSNTPTPPPVDTCTGAVVTVAPNTTATVPAADAPCVSLPADGSSYIVTPNLASSNGPATPVGVEVGSGAPPQMDRLPAVLGSFASTMPSIAAEPHGNREKFDFQLRQKERSFTPAMRGAARARVGAIVAPPVLGSSRVFNVLASITGGGYKRDTAIVKYVGTKIVIYQSQNAPVGGWTDPQIAAIGTTFDTDLYPIDVNAFGAPADIDNNGLVIVLLTPKINALVTNAQCQAGGYIGGYFDGTDEIPSMTGSNGGEIFYGIVPDPNGVVSCAHAVDITSQRTLGTFIHEFQHMISFNQHYLLRGALEEETWLNEGMSHIAEELGSKYYEAKYPAPTGRTDPTQLFPDSSQGFIGGDLGNFYSYLQGTSGVSATIYSGNGTGSLEERGADWLFLRWLGDLKGEAIYAALEQTSLTGTANVEAQAGESFPALFADFSLAVYTDSLPGYPRATAPARDRFQTRNIRMLANRLFITGPLYYPTPYPFVPMTLPISSVRTGTMMVGTMNHWKITMPSTGTELRLHFAATGGGTIPAAYNGQVTIFHCPSASACQ